MVLLKWLDLQDMPPIAIKPSLDVCTNRLFIMRFQIRLEATIAVGEMDPKNCHADQPSQAESAFRLVNRTLRPQANYQDRESSTPGQSDGGQGAHSRGSVIAGIARTNVRHRGL
jgi:hypothetical protein